MRYFGWLIRLNGNKAFEAFKTDGFESLCFFYNNYIVEIFTRVVTFYPILAPSGRCYFSNITHKSSANCSLNSFIVLWKKELAIVISQKEKEILALLKRDNQSGLKILFEEYHGPLCALAFRMVADRDIAKDIVQEVFIKLWAHRQKLAITFSLSAYLKRSVINTALNYLEKDKRSSKVGLEQIGDRPHGNFSDQKISFDELSAQIDQAINNLPVRTRSVFILIRKEEMTYNEVSAALGISSKAVEKEMMKALKLMREMLKNYLLAIFIATAII